jgi:hypothetical protein
VVAEIEYGKTYLYYNCPIKFVPSNIWDFLKRIGFYKEFNVPMPRYEEISARFMSAWQYYTDKFAEFSQTVQEGK